VSSAAVLPDPWFCAACKSKKDAGKLTPFAELESVKAPAKKSSQMEKGNVTFSADVKKNDASVGPAPKKKVYQVFFLCRFSLVCVCVCVCVCMHV
jgi:hypothetical protein